MGGSGEAGRDPDPGKAPGGSDDPKPDLRFGSLEDFDVQVDRELVGDGHHLARGDSTRYLGLHFRSVGVSKPREKLAPEERPRGDATSVVGDPATGADPSLSQPAASSAVAGGSETTSWVARFAGACRRLTRM